ncbi:MAG: hypothetical protein A2277_16785 [Desulfobacterales bacterium RIFOXYA12_FULL_46_15]|nr:MAG: hypothetical protein A2277_16785 [Desulfobacterales bacterium RIFOXYA12_FULL_46_15]
MRILFIHQNFPGQFKHLAPALVGKGHSVTVMTMKKENAGWQGIRFVPYSAERRSTPGMHPWVIEFETKVIRGEALFRAALLLRQEGFYPDGVLSCRSGN